jgi:zona occludens toxin
MPVHGITGQPGNGKTALSLEIIKTLAAKAERPIYYSGVEGMKPGLALEIKDPTTWNDLDPGGDPVCNCPAAPQLHAHVLPNGAFWLVDEAWKWFGHLSDAGRQATPKHVLALAEHRHRGIDMLWTFQMPAQIYPFARGLIADHWHVKRLYGSKLIEVFKWSELQEDVKSAGKRDLANRETRTLPAHVFDQYQSATQHTIKARIPWKLLAIPVGLVVCVVAGWLAWKALQPERVAASAHGSKPGVSAASADETPTPATATKSATPAAPRTAAEWAKLLTPVLPGMPFTAPAYADRPIVSVPRTVCVIGGHTMDLLSSTCRCITEQGTAPIEHISDALCRTIALKGVYDPTRAPIEASPPPTWAAPAVEAAAPGGGIAVGSPYTIGTPNMGKVQGQ